MLHIRQDPDTLCLFFLRVQMRLGSSAVVGYTCHLWMTPDCHCKTSEYSPEVIKLFSYSTQPSTKFILLINVKMPTIVGILTFISMINTPSERLKARNFFICQYFSFYEQLKFRVHWS